MKTEKNQVSYESPELELIAFDICDIITTSGYNGYEPDENEDTDWNQN